MGIINRIALPFLGCGVIGMVICMFLYEMYDRGIVIDEFITGSVTITDVSIFVMLIWFIVAALIAASRS